jgi:large subunit ribosomal protein L25
MSVVTLEAKARTGTGTGIAKKVRAAGRIPAVLYGPGEQPVTIDFSTLDFMRIYHGGHGENVLVDLKLDQGDAKKVLFREVQRDPVTEAILHVDLLHVSLSKKISVRVPVHLIGIAEGVKNDGGIMQFVMRDVEVECLPMNIPESVDIDVSAMNIQDAIHVGDLPTGDFEFTDDHARTVASVIPPTVSTATEDEDAAEAAEVAAEAGAEPERIGEKADDDKKEDDSK